MNLEAKVLKFLIRVMYKVSKRLNLRYAKTTCYTAQMFNLKQAWNGKEVVGDRDISDKRSLKDYLKSGGKCHYCERKVPLNCYSSDHKLARGLGGSDGKYNRVGCCLTCNKAKGMVSYEDFMASVWLASRKGNVK